MTDSTGRRLTSGPIRIMQVVTTAKGGEWFLDQVVELQSRGHLVKAIVPGEGPLLDRLRTAGIEAEVIPLCGWRPRHLPRVLIAQLRLVRALRRFKPDIVHAHLLKAHVACRLAGLAYPRAVQINQITGVTHLRSPALRWIDKVTLRLSDIVVGSCTAFARTYQRLGAKSVAVSHYGCNVNRLDVDEQTSSFRHEYQIPDDVPVVGMVAHMYPSQIRAFKDIGIKGHEVLIDAIPVLIDRIPDVRVLIVGDEFTGTGAYRRALEARAIRLGVADRTHFVGHRSDIQNVLASFDVLASPSLEESASYAVVEALLMKKGVVASDVGGLPDSVQHRETGLLVPPGDPVALATAISELLLSPLQRIAMGELGRRRCLQRFDIKKTVTDVVGIYRLALAKGPNPDAVSLVDFGVLEGSGDVQ